jgi:hypothetical protein
MCVLSNNGHNAVRARIDHKAGYAMTWRWLLLPLCVAICGLGFGLRVWCLGRYTSIPGQVDRLVFWALPCGLTAWAAGAEWWHAVLIVPAIWACSTLALGRDDGSFWRNFAMLSLHGVLGVSFATVLLVWLGHGLEWNVLEQRIGVVTRHAPILNLSGGSLYPAWPVLLAAGACLGACYCIGRHLHSGLHTARDGEAIWGAMVGLGLFVAVAV